MIDFYLKFILFQILNIYSKSIFCIEFYYTLAATIDSIDRYPSYQARLEKETKPFSNGRLLLFHFFLKPIKILPKKTAFFGYFLSIFVTYYKSTRIISKICIFIDLCKVIYYTFAANK